MLNKNDFEFVAAMARLARADRDLYRRLRAEAWAMVAENHAQMSDAERSRWERDAS